MIQRLTIITILFALTGCQDPVELCGKWKLQKLSFPGIIYDLSNLDSAKMNYLEARPHNLSAEDSIAYEKSFDEHIQSLKEMYLLLKNDSTFETNTVLESNKIHTGKFTFDPKTKVLIFSANPNSISSKFQVIALSRNELKLSELTPDMESSMTFNKQD